MTILNYYKSSVYQTGITSNPIYVVCDNTKDEVVAPRFLQPAITLGLVVNQTDVINVTYLGGTGVFNASITNGIVTLVPAIGVFDKDFIITSAQIASFAQVTLQASSGTMQFIVRDVRVNLSTGLTGGGNRALIINDGVTMFNGAGISSSLLATPINTLWGGSGNPMPTTTPINAPSVPGVPVSINYFGGTTDFTGGSVKITVSFERIA